MPKFEVKSHPEMIIVGLKYRGKNEAGEIPKLWGELMGRADEIENRDFSVQAAYGISIMGPNYEQTMVFEYIAGFPVTEAPQGLTEEMAEFLIPGIKYAVITVSNLSSISQAYDAIYRWVKESIEYTFDFSHGNFNFELYGQEYNPPEGSETFNIYVPITSR
jgi:predicted transcriptional regulator YdeE